jgi:hypothetical protein
MKQIPNFDGVQIETAELAKLLKTGVVPLKDYSNLLRRRILFRLREMQIQNLFHMFHTISRRSNMRTI